MGQTHVDVGVYDEKLVGIGGYHHVGTLGKEFGRLGRDEARALTLGRHDVPFHLGLELSVDTFTEGRNFLIFTVEVDVKIVLPKLGAVVGHPFFKEAVVAHHCNRFNLLAHVGG